MSNKLGNESYTRCVAALKEKYSGRGIGQSMQKEVKDQSRTQGTAKNASGSFSSYDARSKSVSNYRSGEYEGGKYMTSDDFVRYFKNRHNFVLPTGSKAVSTAREGSSDSKEGHIRRAVSFLLDLKEKWLPTERREGRTTGEKFRFPALAMCSIAVVAISMALIVSGSVMIGNVSGEIGGLNTEIAVLEAKQTELQSELDLKYDIESIKKDAESLGMIPAKFAGGEYVKISADEEIEVFEKDNNGGAISVLLSAFGIGLE